MSDMVNKHRAFWSNMSDGSAELGYTDESFERHQEEGQNRKTHIYESLNTLIDQYPNHRDHIIHELCNEIRTIKKERGL
ncbi:hypothetical protein [Staphylococcus warneri]|uniref:hypothetical protein n=2 Tax=Staphylococcus TaxID=1279 RepID=UPI000F53F029|nr:hypothetical protein [Staphylococcus warneri]